MSVFRRPSMMGLFAIALFALLATATPQAGARAQDIETPAATKVYWDGRGNWVPGRPPVSLRAFRSCKRFARRLYRKRTGHRVRVVEIKEFLRYERDRFTVEGVIRVFDGQGGAFHRFRCRTKGARVVWFH